MGTRYVIGNSYNPYHNLAIEGELMRHADNGMAILYIWQNEKAIVVGRNQDVYAECKVKDFLDSRGAIARRKSGGGAVYHDRGNLNFSIISMENENGQLRYQELIKNALDVFSLRAEYNGRNDIMVDGYKISGNAAYTEKGVKCQHGTLLIDCDIGKMSLYLTPDKSKLERNRVSSVGSRVANLHWLDSAITVESMRESLVKTSGAKKFEYKQDLEKIRELESFFSGNSWIYGGEK